MKNILKVKLLFGLTLFSMQEDEYDIYMKKLSELKEILFFDPQEKENKFYINIKELHEEVLYKKEFKHIKCLSASQSIIKNIENNPYNKYKEDDNKKLPIHIDAKGNRSINVKSNKKIDSSKLTYFEWDQLNFNHRNEINNCNLDDFKKIEPILLISFFNILGTPEQIQSQNFLKPKHPTLETIYFERQKEFNALFENHNIYSLQKISNSEEMSIKDIEDSLQEILFNNNNKDEIIYMYHMLEKNFCNNFNIQNEKNLKLSYEINKKIFSYLGTPQELLDACGYEYKLSQTDQRNLKSYHKFKEDKKPIILIINYLPSNNMDYIKKRKLLTVENDIKNKLNKLLPTSIIFKNRNIKTIVINTLPY